MRFFNLQSVLYKYKMCLKPHLFFHHPDMKNLTSSICVKTVSTSTLQKMSVIHEDDDSSSAYYRNIDQEKFMSTPLFEEYAKDLLYKDTRDLLLQRIYCCASVEELFNVLEKNIKYYNNAHILQTIFVLHDLLRIFEDVSFSSKAVVKPKDFVEKLQQEPRFIKLMNLIETKMDNFDSTTLSYCVQYLNKLGLSVESDLMQVLCKKLKQKLLTNFSITAVAGFLETVFRNTNLRSYFMSQELIPLVIKEIGPCSTAENLNSLSISLNKLHSIITEDILEKYKQSVERLIEQEILTSCDYKTVLQVIAFLNYPKWREKNSALISKCILLIRNDLNKFSVNEIIILFEIFFKIQEPGLILNDLQRCSYKFFHELDDSPTFEKVSLFLTIIFFSSQHLRNEFQNKVRKYVQDCNDLENLVHLGRLLSYAKVSDMQLCNLYWGKLLDFLKKENQNFDILKISYFYINFTADIDNYRHKKFENFVIDSMSDLLEKLSVFPQKLVNILNFVLLYSEDKVFIEKLVSNLEKNWGQLRPIDFLKLSFAIKLFNEMDRKYIKLPYIRRINNVLDKHINKEITSIKGDLYRNNVLLKCCFYKSRMNRTQVDKLLENYKNFNNICSKSIENIYFCFLMSNTLIPEVLDNIIDYIQIYKDHILGFNAGRMIYLCYCLGYHPKNVSTFCDTVVDIIIRDQERMTGLSLIYSALALCFFNKLPNSLIQSIFNVEFMDKLDNELQQCYAKDKYPQRVRSYLMQLNRAVCLEYPQNNVPWFHQKYINENIKGKVHKPNLFQSRVKECLLKIVQNKNNLKENVVAPYGYEIDFAINCKYENFCVHEKYKKGLALLLLPEFAYTGIVPHLKGNFQLKRKHLEMLGYKVVFIDFTEWITLFFPEDRIDYLKQLIWPKTINEMNKSIS